MELLKKILKENLNITEIYTILVTITILLNIYFNTITIIGLNNQILTFGLVLSLILSITHLPNIVKQVINVLLTPLLIKIIQVTLSIGEINESTLGNIKIRYNLNHIEKYDYCLKKCKELNYKPNLNELNSIDSFETYSEISEHVIIWHEGLLETLRLAKELHFKETLATANENISFFNNIPTFIQDHKMAIAIGLGITIFTILGVIIFNAHLTNTLVQATAKHSDHVTTDIVVIETAIKQQSLAMESLVTDLNLLTTNVDIINKNNTTLNASVNIIKDSVCKITNTLNIKIDALETDVVNTTQNITIKTNSLNECLNIMDIQINILLNFCHNLRLTLIKHTKQSWASDLDNLEPYIQVMTEAIPDQVENGILLFFIRSMFMVKQTNNTPSSPTQIISESEQIPKKPITMRLTQDKILEAKYDLMKKAKELKLKRQELFEKNNPVNTNTNTNSSENSLINENISNLNVLTTNPIPTTINNINTISTENINNENINDIFQTQLVSLNALQLPVENITNVTFLSLNEHINANHTTLTQLAETTQAVVNSNQEVQQAAQQHQYAQGLMSALNTLFGVSGFTGLGLGILLGITSLGSGFFILRNLTRTPTLPVAPVTTTAVTLFKFTPKINIFVKLGKWLGKGWPNLKRPHL